MPKNRSKVAPHHSVRPGRHPQLLEGRTGRRIRIGIVGCGAIGSQLAQWMVTELKSTVSLVALNDLDLSRAAQLKYVLQAASPAVVMLEELVEKSDLVIESASAEAVAIVANRTFQKGKDLLLMSVGGLLQNPQLLSMAQEHGSKVYIPSGAIGGIDAIKAISLSHVKKAILVTRKSPESLSDALYWKQEQKDWRNISIETILFEGNVMEAVRLFPKNLNVSATLKLALPDIPWLVRVIAVPGLKKNIHQIEVEGDTGRMVFLMENWPAPGNQKTSYLAVLSAKALLKEIFSAVKIGN